MRNSWGVTLVEVVASMGIAMLLAGFCFFFIRSSMGESKNLDKVQRYQQDRERLMIELRKDLRSCVAFTPEIKQTLLCVAQIGSRRVPELATVSYRIEGNKIIRRLDSGEGVVFDVDSVAPQNASLNFIIFQTGSAAIVDLGFIGLMPKGFERSEEKIPLPNFPEE